MKRFLRGVALFLLAAGGCDERVRSVDVGFGEKLEGLSGFQCLQDADPSKPLVARVVDSDGNFRPLNLVVDLIEVGDGIPSCRASQILSWCSTRDCHPSEGRRVVLQLDLTEIVPSAPDAVEKVLQLVADLDGKVIFDDVPSGKPLILRVVGTTQAQGGVEATDPQGRYLPFDDASLLGVAYSCPVVLSAASGDLFLGFDALNNRCEAGVVIAAGVF